MERSSRAVLIPVSYHYQASGRPVNESRGSTSLPFVSFALDCPIDSAHDRTAAHVATFALGPHPLSYIRSLMARRVVLVVRSKLLFMLSVWAASSLSSASRRGGRASAFSWRAAGVAGPRWQQHRWRASVAEDTTDATSTPSALAPESSSSAVALPYSLDDIVGLCKRRGFVFPSSEIYNGYAGFYDYGPLGCELKRNVKSCWWNEFVTGREDVVGLDSSIVHNPATWKSSGTPSNEKRIDNKVEFVDPESMRLGWE